MERFFRVIGRVSSIVFLLLIVGAVGVLIFANWSSRRVQRPVEVTVTETSADHEQRDVKLSFGNVETIMGTEIVMVRLAGSSSASFGSYGSKGNYGDVRNALFIKPDGSAAWLFPANRSHICELKQVAETKFALEDYDEADDKTPTLLLEIEFADAAEDACDSHVALQVALAKPDGSGVVTVLKSVDDVLARWLTPSGTFIVIYQIGATLHRAEYARDTFAEISDIAVAELPKQL
jgi:hypothetical protein